MAKTSIYVGEHSSFKQDGPENTLPIAAILKE